ncbi:MAG: integrase core domain-containing protein [Methylobacter sp.]
MLCLPLVGHRLVINTYSESLFKTLKYRPKYPLKPFADVTESRQWVTGLVEWYNNEHRHSAIRFVTPVQRHEGLDENLLDDYMCEGIFTVSMRNGLTKNVCRIISWLI